MILEHIGLSQINGSLVVLDDVKGVQYDEMVELHLSLIHISEPTRP